MFYLKECGPIRQRYVRSVFAKASKVLVLGQSWKTWIAQELQVPVAKVEVLYNAVEPQQASSFIGAKHSILFLGQVGERKGVTDLLLAFKALKSQLPDAVLNIGGNGDIEKYQRFVAEHNIEDVSFLGWVGPEQKHTLLNETRVYTLPSYNEGFPMGVIEAMSYGVPVVASNVGGIPDALPNEKIGFIVEPGDHEALTEYLFKLLTNEDLHRDMSTNSYRYFNDNFSTRRMEQTLIDIYQSLGAK